MAGLYGKLDHPDFLILYIILLSSAIYYLFKETRSNDEHASWAEGADDLTTMQKLKGNSKLLYFIIFVLSLLWVWAALKLFGVLR